VVITDHFWPHQNSNFHVVLSAELNHLQTWATDIGNAYIWMQPKNGVYEYIPVYVNDLVIALADLQEFVDVLEKNTSLSSRELEQLLFSMAVTSSMMTKVSCAWPQRNTLRR
jgi:hypothetical protein